MRILICLMIIALMLSCVAPEKSEVIVSNEEPLYVDKPLYTNFDSSTEERLSNITIRGNRNKNPNLN